MAMSTPHRSQRSTSTSGVDGAARSRAATKSGDSSTRRRIHQPISTSTADSRNGTRHPQLANACSFMVKASTASTAVQSRLPRGPPACGHEVQ
jgi:hypothetical protein